VGLGAFLLLGVRAIGEIGGIGGIRGTGGEIPLAVLASAAGLLVESNFINSLFYPWIMIWVWTMLALTGSQTQNSNVKSQN
jgi:hypothetical protein